MDPKSRFIDDDEPEYDLVDEIEGRLGEDSEIEEDDYSEESFP